MNVFLPDEPLDATARGSEEAFPAMRFRASPAWVSQVLDQLERLAGLPPNWDSYGASAPNQTSLQIARAFLEWISQVVGVEKPDVGVTANGNAALLWEWDQGRRNLDVEILDDGTFRYSFVHDESESADREGSTNNLLEIVHLLTQW